MAHISIVAKQNIALGRVFPNFCHGPKIGILSHNLMTALVELPYISFKNLAEVEHIRHYLQESCKYLTFQTKPVKFCQIKNFLQFPTFVARCLQVRIILSSFVDGSCKTLSEKWNKYQQEIIWHVQKVLKLFLQICKNQIIIRQFFGTIFQYNYCDYH